MPSPKSKSSSRGKGSPKKSSPKVKGSPKKSPKGNEKLSNEGDKVFVYVRPPPPPPPPVPQKGPLLSQLRRQVWYPYANRILFEIKEWFWTPHCSVITSWGDIWITDPPQRRIMRYNFDPVSAKACCRKPCLNTRGEPRMMTELPLTGRIAVLLTCPTAKKTTLVLYDPVELKEDIKIDFKYMTAPPNDCPVETQEGEREPFAPEDDSTPIGICANQDLLFVLFYPIHKLHLYDPVTLKRLECRVENAYPDESSCIHYASSAGCAASHDKLCVAATRPPRVQIFWIHRQALLSRIDRVDLTWYAEIGLDRLSIGEPFGIQLDSLGLLVVSDSRAGYFRVYNLNDKRPPGPWLPSFPHGETCFMGSWKIDNYQDIRPGYFSLGKNGTACVVDRWANKVFILADRTELRWYDETLFVLDDFEYIRSALDPHMPLKGLPPLPSIPFPPRLMVKASDLSIQMTDEELLPDWLVKRYANAMPTQDELPAALGPKGKTPPKSKSPKKKSPKSSKSPKSRSKK